MSDQVVVPSFGESITEVIIDEWLVKEGDSVSEDDPIVSIESDKATLEVPAPASGVLAKILKGDGETVSVGEVIAEIQANGDGGDRAAKAQRKAEPKDESQPDQKKAQKKKAQKKKAEAAEPKEAERQPEVHTEAGTGQVIMGPAARRLVESRDLDPTEIETTGPGGRLLKEDVQRHLDRAAKPSREAPAAPEPPAERRGERSETSVPMSPIRRVIAQRLVHATQTTAMLTTFNEVDMSRVIALRKSYKDAFQERHGVKLGFMSFFVRATIEALKAFPAVNAEIRDENIVYKDFYDIGVAVSSKKGLTVPVIRDADRLSFAEIEQVIADYGRRARDNKLKLDELKGGTFTISNGGIYGSMLSTPILNPPQSGILGMHNIVERPVVVDGEIVVRPIMFLALTYDHRIVDGREAVQCLVRIASCIENPERMLLEI